MRHTATRESKRVFILDAKKKKFPFLRDERSGNDGEDLNRRRRQWQRRQRRRRRRRRRRLGTLCVGTAAAGGYCSWGRWGRGGAGGVRGRGGGCAGGRHQGLGDGLGGSDFGFHYGCQARSGCRRCPRPRRSAPRRQRLRQAQCPPRAQPRAPAPDDTHDAARRCRDGRTRWW